MTDPWSDKIFDSLLEEVLTNQHPPDLTEQIQQRLREERGYAQAATGRVALQRPSVASGAALNGTPLSGTALSGTAGSVSPNGSRGGSATGTSLSRWRAAGVAMLTLSAGLLIAVGVWQLWLATGGDEINGATTAADTAAAGSRTVADVASTGTPAADGVSAARPSPVQQTPASKLAANGQPAASGAQAREDLSLENLPFSADDGKPAFVREPASVVALPVKAWSDGEVVTWLDERFAALWAGQHVQPGERLGAEAEAARISLVLTGGDLPAASNVPPRELAGKLLRSATFAEHWADRVVAYWLRGTPAADKRDPDGMALRASLAQQIVARKPWNEIVASLISSQPEKPEAAFLAQLAGGDNHRLAGRVGAAVLGEALACARCHDASDNGRLISTDQDEYWSLVAIFNGVGSRDAAGSPEQPAAATEPVRKELVDRQAQLFADGKSPNVFFDRPDGRLQAAHYRLPGGDNWRTMEGVTTPRESLARWIASTSVTDHAAVNTAWRLVYGRPLVAQHAALDGEGWTQRREMLDTLALQFQAHGRDVSQLVGWLVSAEPFRTQPLAVDRQKWLLASDEEVARWNLANVNFASFKSAPANASQLSSLEGALASVVRWSSTRDERRATLAQPSPAAPAADGNAQPQAANGQGAMGKSDDAPANYLVRSLQPTAAQSEFIKRLVSSKLSWPQQVEHVAGLVGESGKEGRLQQTADRLLELKNGDRSAALFQLLQSALLCEEAS